MSSDHWDEYFDLSGHLITEYMNGGWSRSEIYAGGLHLGNYSHFQTNFTFTDWLGNLRMLRDQNGNGVESCVNLPFGDGQSCTGAAYASQLFTGDEHDAETGLEHTLFRQMSGTEGRWLSPDPYMGSMDIGNPQSLNRYAYVNNDPVNAVDPSGLEMIDPWGCGFFGILACGPPIDECADAWFRDSHAGCPGDSIGSGAGIGIGIVIGGGGGGGGGTTSAPPPANPPGNQPIHFPNETNGLPNGYRFAGLTWCQTAGTVQLADKIASSDRAFQELPLE